MHDDLKEVIAVARATRDALIRKEIGVKESNSIYNHNHSIATAYAIDLRERIFIAESAGMERSLGALERRETAGIETARADAPAELAAAE